MKMLKICVTTALFLIPALSLAQSNKIQRPIAKEVQKINNKAWISTERLLTASSLTFLPISKDVQRVSNRIAEKQRTGNMVSFGYPSWIISKGVQRLSAPKKGSAGQASHY